jgi:Mn2+/Fe2+ NRAMP family transporter
MLILINDKHLMGQYRNSKLFNMVSWVTVIIMVALTLALTATIFFRTT